MAGCSDDDSGGDDGSNGNEQGVDWSSVNPPPNIDITSCYDVTYDGDSDPDLRRVLGLLHDGRLQRVELHQR